MLQKICRYGKIVLTLLPKQNNRMNDNNEKTLNLFTTRVRQMILQYEEIQKENDELYKMVDDRDKQIAELEKRLHQSENDYKSLKMARMLEVTGGDVEGAKKTIAGLIRDVNTCISLLSEEQPTSRADA